MSETNTLHALFGGTFDPIHYGHLRPVAALARQVGLRQVTLLPNNVPPHRSQPLASPSQRIKMIELAIAKNPLFTLDLREMQRSTPSWTVETLSQLRAERGNQPLGFIIGQDSLLTLSSWHRWQELLHFCHLLVCKRPGWPARMATETMQQWLKRHQTANSRDLHHQPAGLIWLADTPMLAISATDIRQRLYSGLPCDDFLPAAVIDWIKREGLYQSPH